MSQRTQAFISLLFFATCSFSAFAQAPATAKAYRGMLTREAHLVNGLSAPIPMYAAQIEQESGWKPAIVAYDGGVGLAQFMSGTASEISTLYPELGKPVPASPGWAIPALIRYDTYLGKHVQGADDCQRRAAALKSYNAGLGYVQQAQQKSKQAGTWFGLTEYIPTKQSPKNFENSRQYPHWIIGKRQPNYTGWGAYTCEGMKL